jgi:hypothetical protein
LRTSLLFRHPTPITLIFPSPYPPQSTISSFLPCPVSVVLTQARQYYCKNCTAHVYHQQEVLGDDKIVLRTGLLDNGRPGAGLKPAAEIYGKARFDWEKEVAQTFDTMPPS